MQAAGTFSRHMYIARFSSAPLVRLSHVRRLYVLVLLPSVFLPHLQSICCPCLSRSSCFPPSSGHCGHTPGSHFSEGRTWIPFPLHNDGKLHRLHHACVFESQRWNPAAATFPASERMVREPRTVDCLMMLSDLMVKPQTGTWGSVSERIIFMHFADRVQMWLLKVPCDASTPAWLCL